MQLHQIRYFLALSEELSFRRAARRCNVAQSSLSRGIRALEVELGGPLFHRERGNSHLSRLGQIVRPLLAEAYAHVEGAQRQAQDFLRRASHTLPGDDGAGGQEGATASHSPPIAARPR